MDLIELRDIHKTYYLGEVDVPVLKGISLRVAQGELVALMGTSGSGKSTLMNILGCLDHPTTGEYWLNGEEISWLSAKQRARVRKRMIGFVFQTFNLLPRTSALENVMMPLAYVEDMAERQMRQHATELLQELSATQPLPITPPEVPVGLPSDLLRRRPDIHQAEAQIHVATAQIGVATADLFPKFSLTGSLTYQSDVLQSLLTGASRSWSFGPALSWPIFQGGSIRSNIHVQEALRDQAFIMYQKTVLTALQEVENALIAFDKEWEHSKALNDAVVANRKAVDLSMQLYAQGQTDFLSVLDAQRSLYASEDALVQSTRNTATDVIAIYKALGGGWEDEPSGAVTLCCG